MTLQIHVPVIYVVHVLHCTASGRRYIFCTQSHVDMSESSVKNDNLQVFFKAKRVPDQTSVSSSTSDTGLDEALSPNLSSEA